MSAVKQQPRNISHPSYYHTGKGFKRYYDLDHFHAEITEENRELKETIASFKLWMARLDKVTKERIYSDHWNRPIDEEPEFKALLRLAEIENEHGDPVSQDYDAMRDLATSNRETGELPW